MKVTNWFQGYGLLINWDTAHSFCCVHALLNSIMITRSTASIGIIQGDCLARIHLHVPIKFLAHASITLFTVRV